MKRTIIAVLALALFVSAAFAQDRMTGREEQPKPRFEKREAFTVAGVEIVNDMKDETYTKVWEDFSAIQPKLPEGETPIFYGVTYASGKLDPQKGPGYMYFAGIEVADGKKIPDGVKIHKVPAGYYAVFEHHGSIDSIDKTYEYIYGRWMFESGQKPAQQDMFEIYDERFQPGSEESVVEIWVPVIYGGGAEPEHGLKQEKELNQRVAPEVVPDEKPDLKVEKE